MYFLYSLLVIINFKYILEYRNKAWTVSKEAPTKGESIITEEDFNTDNHCPKIRVEVGVEVKEEEYKKLVNPLLATMDGKKCGTKEK